MGATAQLTNYLTVVVSAGQSRNPEKRQLEDTLAELAANLPGVCVMRVPHLYDLPKNSQTYQSLQLLDGDLVVVCWLFDRATHWILDRNGVRGQVGEVLLRDASEEEEAATESAAEVAEDEIRVSAAQPRPSRSIYCLDFRVSSSPQEFVAEIARIAALVQPQDHETFASQLPDEQAVRDPLAELRQRFEEPTNDTYVGNPVVGEQGSQPAPQATLLGASSIIEINESLGRRWYPVIDFSRCTNCMECIDFCLFGVYGVDGLDTIVVEQADNCRKGCPACSRVCPQNAIIFPQHKTPAIAGAPVDASGMKIDLSKLFGAPESDEDAAVVAARERDEQLILAGREAVGVPTGLSERLSQAAANETPADDLDALIDQLDSLDL